MDDIMTLAGLTAMMVLTACDYSEEQYAQDACEWMVACIPDSFESVDDCVADDEPDESCTFDAEAARKCADGLDDVACPAEDEIVEFPSACSDVYDCPVGDDARATRHWIRRW